MKRPPAWVPYAIGAAVVGVAGYFIYRKLSVGLPAIGQELSTGFIDIFKPKGVTNVATQTTMTLPETVTGGQTISVQVSPEYQKAINGFVANNPQYTATQITKMLIAAAWKVGDPAPAGLNNWQ